MSENRSLIFKSVPEGLPVAHKDLVVLPVPVGPTDASSCPENGVLLPSLYASIDPYQRGRMQAPEVKSYSPPFVLGQPINSRGVAKILQSNSPRFKPGELVIGFLPIQEYIAIDESRLAQLHPLMNPLGIEDIRVFLGALGIPRLAAYAGLLRSGSLRRRRRSSSQPQAALWGRWTIGSVSSKAKLEFITEKLGFHAASTTMLRAAEALARLAPDGVDIYWDNVGGEHLEAALEHMKNFGRIVMCGAIAEYDHSAAEQMYPLREYSRIFTKRLTVREFIVSDKNIMGRYGKEHQERVQKWIKDGTIRTATWEVESIANALLSGANFGKVVLKY